MLQITMKALNNLKFEKEIENVKNVRNLSNHLSSYKVYHDKMGSQLRTVVNHYNKSSGI